MPGLPGLRGLAVVARVAAALAVAAVAASGSSGTLPEDPQFNQQWALRNTGQEVNGTTGTSAAAATAALDGHPDGGLPLEVATGTGYPDGLTATALAARTGAILLLVPPDDLTHADATVGFLDEHGHRLHDRHILGGTTAISEQVADQLTQQ